jgi:hypothetical protein
MDSLDDEYEKAMEEITFEEEEDPIEPKLEISEISRNGKVFI